MDVVDVNTPPPAAPVVPPPAAAPAPNAAPSAAPNIDASLLGREPAAPPPVAGDVVPDWLASLPDDLKADKTLSRFQTVEDLAKGLTERQRMLGERIPMPKADDPDSLLRFAAALRPETADAYKVELDEAADPAFADHMKPMFHEAGLQQWQVDILTKGNNEFMKGLSSQMENAGKEAIENLRAEMGNESFEQSKQAAVALLTRLGIPAQFDSDMARFMGAENSLRYFFALAKSAGELGKISGSDVQLALGQMTPEAAEIEAARMTSGKDPKMVEALRDMNSPESQRLDQLAAIIARAQNQP